MKLKFILCLIIFLFAIIACDKKPKGWGKISTTIDLSPVFTVDKIYKSMLGPFKTRELTISESNDAELIWITGFQSVVVSEDGLNQLSQEFMCHSNLRYKAPRNRRFFKSTRHRHGRLFTISQGQTEVEFPAGFGIPIMANEELLLDNQLLNMNMNPVNRNEPLKLRYKNTVTFIKGKDTNKDMIPLYQVEAGIMVSLDDKGSYYNTLNPSEIQEGAICAPGMTATTKWRVTRKDMFGQNFTYHWILKPGRETRHTLITRQINLKFDTTIHCIAVHMHPYAESLVLKDLTDNKVLYTSKMKSFDDKIGLEKVDFFSSTEGIPVYKDHEYEIISIYNNTTTEDRDAMALIYIYLFDREFNEELLARNN